MSNQKLKRRLTKIIKSKWAYGILETVCRALPHKKTISFASFPDLTDNARAFYDYLSRTEEKGVFSGYEYVWHVDKNTQINVQEYPNCTFVRRHTIRSVVKLFQSDYLISTHGLYNALPLSRRRTSILVSHGMPLKTSGYLNQADIRDGVMLGDYYIVTSVLYKKLFKDIYHATDDQVLITGQPRNDWLFEKLSPEKEAHIRGVGEHIVMYMPTFRKCNLRDVADGDYTEDPNKAFGGTKEEWQALNAILKESNQVMVVKPHPMDAISNVALLKDMDSIKVIDDTWLTKHGILLYQFLAYTDKLVTDYSNVYVDYLLTNKPIGFFVADLDQYAANRGFVFSNPMEFMPGKIFKQFSDLNRFVVEEDYYEQERKHANSILNEITEGVACKTLFSQLNEVLTK